MQTCKLTQNKQTIVDSKFEDITANVFDSLESDADKETDDEAEEYEPEVRPEHNETEHDSNAVLKRETLHTKLCETNFLIFDHMTTDLSDQLQHRELH